MTNVIDISKWQVSYDANTAKAQGVNDVILRCAYATSKDTCFDEFYTAAKGAGQTVGAYGFATWHYSSKNDGDIDTARAAMIEQTNAWIAICDGKLDGYLAIDQELESGYSMGLTPSQNEILLSECIAMLEAAGFIPCIYCSVSWAMAQFDKDKVNADLWLAYYPSAYASVDFDAAPDYASMSGTYYAYMQGCGDKLCGWQFGSTGWGAKYGCGSENLDRNLFYKAAGSAQSNTPYSTDAIQLKISDYTSTEFSEIVALVGSLGIVCDTSTLSEGYFITGPASSGDQVSILDKCAALGIEAAPYFAPLSEVPVQLAIRLGDIATLATICAFVGGMGVVCYTTLLDGYIVTGEVSTAQQQEILCENLVWNSSVWVYTMPETDAPAVEDTTPEESAPELDAVPETEEALPEPETEEAPEPEAQPEDESEEVPQPEELPEETAPEVEESTPETEVLPETDEAPTPEGNKNEQINALLTLIRTLLQKVLALLN